METIYDSAGHKITYFWATSGNELREISEEIRKIEDELYRGERMEYLQEVFGCLRGLQEISKPFRSFDDIPCTRANIPPKVLNTLQNYAETHQRALGKLNDLCERLDGVLSTMEVSCGTYKHVDSEDVHFYTTLNLRINKAKDTFQMAKTVLKCVENGSDYCAFLSEEGFSFELRLSIDCETFPVLRLVPDLGQKLLSVCSTCQDWLTSDRVYVELIENEVGRLKSLVSRHQWKIRRTETQQNELFTALRTAQEEVGFDCEKQCEDIKRRLTEDSDSAFDPSSHCARLTTRLVDLETTIGEIQQLRKALKNLAKQKARETDEYREVVHKLNEIEHLLKRNILLTSADGTDGCKEPADASKRHKRRHSVECGTNDVISDVVSRFKLSEQMRRRSLDDWRPIKLHREKTEPITLHLTSTAMAKTHGQSKQRRVFSAELHRAFRIVKNNIGFGWKDLARCLPYWNGKRMSEIENDIAEIEYQHKGQLKEQAYQCLVSWYRYNGARATVKALCETLRELDEIRLMEKIEDSRNQSFLPDIRCI